MSDNLINKINNYFVDSLRTIDLSTASTLKDLGILVIPCQIWCYKCRIEFSTWKVIDETNEMNDDNREADSDNVVEFVLSSDNNRSSLNSTLIGMDISPFKIHVIPKHSRISHGRKKAEEVKNKLLLEENIMQNKIASLCNVSRKRINKLEEKSNQTMLQEKAKDLDTIVDLMNEKLEVSPRKKKIQILTMAPPSWSIEKMKTEFSITFYMARTARTLAKEKGILSLPQPKKGKNLSEKTKSLLQDFYCNDEYSRVMPSKKDCVSIKKNTHVQKRLILCNLKELYANFKEQHSDIKIGFSTFCLLRPKWCVNVGASGTHCLCMYHSPKCKLNAF